MEPKSRRCIALTFDDGPSPYTLQILQILKKFQIKATFFVTGESLSLHPEILQSVVLDGHTVGNHTLNHPDITKISQDDLHREIHSLNIAIKKIIQQDVKIFRPPYGAITKETYRAVYEIGLFPVLWNLDTNDWDLSQTEPIEDRVMRGLKEHNIILMHDGGGPREQTVKALPGIIKSLKQKGYEFVTIPDYFHYVYNRRI
ncbi:polysaccharide deacetylase family protein [Niallia nealsonii]|uniref:Polysaccharide deacetylase family protein n=1 Tax=Niallia nealsonii TaxID=115979 RepID=A0A2N0YWX8_9BACI|nr:polysaccharide deacetylase family protein [Niallia nealsonii]PKG21761.1 polysaccharide deacetylase family protein [Niallia nealsonii]